MIDVNYDFRGDLKNYEDDVDKYSLTLKKYHKLLWQKTLPNGILFELLDTKVGEYFIFKYNTNEMRLSSDWLNNTYLHWTQWPLNVLRNQIENKKYENFCKIAHTIGNFIIFPKYPIGLSENSKSINQIRGTHDKIKDRFDITLECIKRYYLKIENKNYYEDNPLFNVFNNFKQYFQLFINFKGFCKFFLLQDLTINNFENIKYFLPFNGFEINPYPKTTEEYHEYMKNTMEFINSRNSRINEEYNKV
jgi:hypothetical protein